MGAGKNDRDGDDAVMTLTGVAYVGVTLHNYGEWISVVVTVSWRHDLV